MGSNRSKTAEHEGGDSFEFRHIGPSADDQSKMLRALGFATLDDFTAAVLPESIVSRSPFALRDFPAAKSEQEVLARLREIAALNRVTRSYIGLGYYDCLTPPVILRNILENPGWYTQYTPYQPEISQGRLEALLNFQTMIADLTGLPIANASLLDEGTAAAEAMNISLALSGKDSSSDSSAASGDAAAKPVYFVSEGCHPQTIAVVRTRAEALGIAVQVSAHDKFEFNTATFGALLQYPDTFGHIADYSDFMKKAGQAGVLVTVAADPLALTLLEPPGRWGADIVIGSTQRFGVPLGYGGPHAAYMATREEYKRQIPGRLVGVSKDSNGRPALRLSLQTREQHIRREKATSNICTAQVLLAVIAGMYAVYHGPDGLRRIARRIHALTGRLAAGLAAAKFKLQSESFFDTVTLSVGNSQRDILDRAVKAGINLRVVGKDAIGISLDETTTEKDVAQLLEIFGVKTDSAGQNAASTGHWPSGLNRKGEILTHPVFHRYHSETEFLRYVRRLESRDLSLTTAMIPLGSCTMKLNATCEMIPVTWPEFGAIHPFAPLDQVRGYRVIFDELERALADVTGFDAVSLQPNAGSQGEYAGLLAIKAYHESRGDMRRTICLIPKSAHGTNPASAVMAGMKVIVVNCDDEGNIDLADLKAKAAEHTAELSCVMVTYPSTHGVFEEGIKELSAIVHANGGQVYMDGANLNALVGLCKPAELGADVCHINLHKTFCIPHGGGGPGMGPIGVRKHLAPFLPGHPFFEELAGVASAARTGKGSQKGSPVGPVSAAPWGSASILLISWAYLALMGTEGVRRATQVAILNANYIAERLEKHYPVLYRGRSHTAHVKSTSAATPTRFVAHECILDLRNLKEFGVEVDDVAKRLMDYGFHAPTVSWPVAGTMMVEPTESESKYELDRFCDALIAIHGEAAAIGTGGFERASNPLKNAPHTAEAVTADKWDRPYSREVAAFPARWTREHKFWPYVGRIDAAYGDKNLVCACPPIDQYSDS